MPRTGNLAILGRLGQQGTDVGGVAGTGDNLVIASRPELHRRFHLCETVGAKKESQPQAQRSAARWCRAVKKRGPIAFGLRNGAIAQPGAQANRRGWQLCSWD